MAPTFSKKRKVGEVPSSKAPRPTKRTRDYSRFNSDSDSAPSTSTRPPTQPADPVLAKVDSPSRGKHDVLEEPSGDEDSNSESSDSSASDASDMSDLESTTSSRPDAKKRKRNDPGAFATSISKILGSKLSTSKRADPVLARSKSAATATHEMAEARLEVKARQKLREDKKAEMDRGRIKDVLGGGDEENAATVGATLEMEKRLRRTAQRGVIKLFNAVRAAQVKAEQAEREARNTGVVGVTRREERVTEMSKKGFLDLVAGGGVKEDADEMR